MEFLLMILFLLVFARLDSQEFQSCFLNWVKSISQLIPGEVISIDGKTLRHSYDTESNKKAIHMEACLGK